MHAIIPVAGFGSRLRPHTYSIPKVLLNVAGKPIIAHILDKIIADGFTQATIIVGYLGDQIRDYVRSRYSIQVDFIDQEERKGLAHAIYLARKSFTEEPLLIILGDTIFDVDLRAVLKGDSSAIGVKHVDDPRRFGIAEVENDFVTRLVEKPEHPISNLAIVGLYWIRKPKLLEAAISELMNHGTRTKGEYQLTDALALMLQRGEKIKVFNVEGWFDCGKPETLLETNRHLLEKQPQPPEMEGVVIIPPVFIDRGAQIQHSIIGPYATVARGAVVADSVIRNSIVGEEAHVSDTLLESSIIGSNAIVRGSFRRINIGDSSEIDFH